MKILVSYPNGFAVMADLKRDMAILATSGRDWAERTKRLGVSVALRPLRIFVRNRESAARRVVFSKGAHNGRPFGRHKTTVVVAYRSVCWLRSQAVAG
ncbi:hypothetical protein SAMN05216338_1001261 [Bradyrhizobium sp. Rc2d]|nr:hypothetical protein SAMN05216338_1001261 [Bradyrhizobium sp. Rc2d]